MKRAWTRRVAKETCRNRSSCRGAGNIAYIDDDTLVEVAPGIVLLRKRYLNPHERKRQARADT